MNINILNSAIFWQIVASIIGDSRYSALFCVVLFSCELFLRPNYLICLSNRYECEYKHRVYSCFCQNIFSPLLCRAYLTRLMIIFMSKIRYANRGARLLAEFTELLHSSILLVCERLEAMQQCRDYMGMRCRECALCIIINSIIFLAYLCYSRLFIIFGKKTDTIIFVRIKLFISLKYLL